VKARNGVRSTPAKKTKIDNHLLRWLGVLHQLRSAKPSPEAIEEFVATFADSQQPAPASPAGLVGRGDPRRS
jgi:hypothetical protein